MINRLNIVDYINFLYKKKYKQQAPQDLLESWTGLNDNETIIHLNGLYRHWNLDNISAKKFEEEFLNLGNKNAKTPIMPSPEIVAQQQALHLNSSSPTTAAAKKSNSSWIVVLAIAVLAVGGYFIYDASTKEVAPPPDVLATDSVHKQIAKAPPMQQTQAEDISEPLDETDQTNMSAIKELYASESDRNFDNIYQYFDPNLERYWDINYPTFDEMKARYENTWETTENNKHSNIRIKKVSENTYDVFSTYSYHSLKDQKQKTVNSKVRFVFNDQNRIIKTYGL
jgi:Rieske Fe-S protein